MQLTPPETSIDTQIELLKHISEVHSRIKHDVTTDFVLSKLDEQDKEMSIEMVASAYLGKSYVMLMREKMRVWTWNAEKKQWEQYKLSEEDGDLMNTHGNTLFDTYMIRPYMVSILNRNVANNHILNILGKAEDEQPDAEPVGMMDKLKKLVGKKKKEGE